MEITKDHNYMEGVWAAKSLPNYIQNTEYVTIEQAIVVKQELIDNFEKEFGYHTDMDEYDRNYSYFGVRGFGRPGDYNSRILLLIDGRKINDNVYGSAFVGNDFPVYGHRQRPA